MASQVDIIFSQRGFTPDENGRSVMTTTYACQLSTLVGGSLISQNVSNSLQIIIDPRAEAILVVQTARRRSFRIGTWKDPIQGMLKPFQPVSDHSNAQANLSNNRRHELARSIMQGGYWVVEWGFWGLAPVIRSMTRRSGVVSCMSGWGIRIARLSGCKRSATAFMSRASLKKSNSLPTVLAISSSICMGLHIGSCRLFRGDLSFVRCWHASAQGV